MELINAVQAQINTHEAVCAERYTGILTAQASLSKSITSVNKWIITVGLMVMAGMGATLMALLFHERPM
jgi:serine/threonine protein phosphatase PrpC